MPRLAGLSAGSLAARTMESNVERTPSLLAFSRVMILIAALVTISMRVGPALAETTDPLLVVLSETGSTKDGLPVLRRHPDPEQVVRLLSRGFSGRLLRLYWAEQRGLRPSHPVGWWPPRAWAATCSGAG
jgi:hypothetical protein